MLQGINPEDTLLMGRSFYCMKFLGPAFEFFGAGQDGPTIGLMQYLFSCSFLWRPVLT